MVRRKPSRAPSRAKPLKPDITINEDDDDATIRKDNVKKRLDDFDMQVKEILMKMEADTQAVLDSIKDLYFVDEQRTSPNINNMLWINYLKQNTPCPKSAIRDSIAELINITEDSQLLNTQRKRQRKGPTISSKALGILVPPTTGRTARNRQTKKMHGNNTENDIQTPSLSTRPQRGNKNDLMSTPMHQAILPLPSHMLITPKFDPRTPLPFSTLRKPKLGEIAVSLRGSPLQVGPKEFHLNLANSDLNEETREQLEDLHKKVSQLLQI